MRAEGEGERERKGEDGGEGGNDRDEGENEWGEGTVLKDMKTLCQRRLSGRRSWRG